MTPAKTPVRLPRRVAGSIPARSSASQDVSSSSRCCASVASASLRAHPEELGVELRRVMEESAGAGGDGALAVGVVECRRLPAAVGREVRDGVHAFGHQLPQVLGRGDAAREAAGHADDDDRVVRQGRQGGHREAGRCLRLRAEQLVQEVACQGVGRRIVEHESSPGAAVRRPCPAGCGVRSRSASRSRGPGRPGPGSTVSGLAWPRTAATCPRTTSSSAARRSGRGQPGQALHDAGRPRWRRHRLVARTDQAAQQRLGLALRAERREVEADRE